MSKKVIRHDNKVVQKGKNRIFVGKEPPPKETSGDTEFDEAIDKLLKPHKK